MIKTLKEMNLKKDNMVDMESFARITKYKQIYIL